MKKVPTILMLDDQPEVLQTMAETLGARGIAYRSCSTPMEFKRFCENEQFAVILCDYDLGTDTTGEDLIKSVRRDPRNLNYRVPIFLVSANVDIDLFKRIEPFVNDVITKPYKPAQLIKRLARYLPGLNLESDDSKDLENLKSLLSQFEKE